MTHSKAKNHTDCLEPGGSLNFTESEGTGIKCPAILPLNGGISKYSYKYIAQLAYFFAILDTRKFSTRLLNLCTALCRLTKPHVHTHL